MSIYLTLGQKLLFDMKKEFEKKRKIGYVVKSKPTKVIYAKKQKTYTPSVLVKVVSKGTQDNLYAVLKYITQENKNKQEKGENGALKLENQNGELMNYRDIIDDYKPTMSKRKNGKDFYHLVLSTKESQKDEKLVREAIKATLQKQFKDKGFDYSFIAHTDTDNLHYHIIINKHNKIMKNTLDINKETLYNTRKQFADELNIRDFNYKELETLTKEEIHSINKKERKRKINSSYKYKMEKILKLKQNDLIKIYQSHLDELKKIKDNFDMQKITIKKLYEKYKTKLKNKEITKEEYDKKYKIITKRKKRYDNKFKIESKTIFGKTKLIYNSVNSSFFMLDHTIRTNNERISELGMFKFGKSSISLEYEKITEELIKNYKIKERLYQMQKDKSNKNYQFDEEKTKEFEKLINVINSDYISKNLSKEIEKIKDEIKENKIRKENEVTLINNRKIKELINNLNEHFKDKKVNILNEKNILYNIKTRENIIKKTNTYLFKSEENKARLKKLENKIEEFKKLYEEIDNNKVKKILSFKPKFKLDREKSNSIKFYFNHYDNMLKKIKKLNKEKINDENTKEIRKIRLLRIELRNLIKQNKDKKTRKIRYNNRKGENMEKNV